MSSELRALWENAGGKCPVDAEIVSFDSLLKDSKSLAVGVMYPGEHTLGGIPLIKVGDVSGGRVISKPSYLISDEVNKEYVRTQLKGDELLVTLVGNPGECVVITPEMAGWNAARAIAVAKLKDPSLRTYVKAVLESYAGKHLIDSVLNTTVQKTLNLKDLKKLPIPLPSKDKVHQISDFVNSIDDRITLLRETNTTLKAIAQALFKSWFVDFDPVHAKQQGRAPEGMDAQTAALFPDSFEESELGMVPKGWRASNLGEIASFQNGYAFKSKDWQDSGHPVVKIGDVKPGIIDLSGCSFVSPSTLKGLDRFGLFRGDLLVGMTGYVGETGLVPSHSPQAFLNQRVGRIAAKHEQACFEYIYCAIRNSAFKEFAVSQSHGSAQANVSGASILEYPIVLPCEKIINAFSGIVKVLIEKILTNHEQALALASCRDTLLPRLISGQLRLPEAQALVEDAVDA